MRVTATLFLSLLLAAASIVALAQNFPNKSIRYVVPYAPGGSTDIVARLIAQKMSETIGQQVVVDNRTGAGGIIAAEALAKSPPDGIEPIGSTPEQFQACIEREKIKWSKVVKDSGARVD